MSFNNIQFVTFQGQPESHTVSHFLFCVPLSHRHGKGAGHRVTCLRSYCRISYCDLKICLLYTKGLNNINCHCCFVGHCKPVKSYSAKYPSEVLLHILKLPFFSFGLVWLVWSGFLNPGLLCHSGPLAASLEILKMTCL